jgi:hypothetical protein
LWCVPDNVRCVAVFKSSQGDGYLRRHDQAVRRIMNTVEMPDRLAADFVIFTRQNDGSLSRKRREHEFEALTDQEVHDLEEIVRVAFDSFDVSLTSG